MRWPYLPPSGEQACGARRWFECCGWAGPPDSADRALLCFCARLLLGSRRPCRKNQLTVPRYGVHPSCPSHPVAAAVLVDAPRTSWGSLSCSGASRSWWCWSLPWSRCGLGLMGPTMRCRRLPRQHQRPRLRWRRQSCLPRLQRPVGIRMPRFLSVGSPLLPLHRGVRCLSLCLPRVLSKARHTRPTAQRIPRPEPARLRASSPSSEHFVCVWPSSRMQPVSRWPKCFLIHRSPLLRSLLMVMTHPKSRRCFWRIGKAWSMWRRCSACPPRQREEAGQQEDLALELEASPPAEGMLSTTRQRARRQTSSSRDHCQAALASLPGPRRDASA